MSIEGREIAKTPFAVIDVETTGLSPRDDRVVEIAIAVVKHGEEPKLVLETLVHPERAVAGTEIHGIGDADVADAPTFAQIAPAVVAALSNRVVASHNVYFDVRMLAAELDRSGYPSDVPCVCTMLLPLALDTTSPRLTLAHACARHGVPFERGHCAGVDAVAAAKLLQRYCVSLRKRGIRTFGELRAQARREYEFFASFDLPPLPPPPVIHSGKGLRPRDGGAPTSRQREGVARYFDELLDAAADLELSDEELCRLEQVRTESALPPDEVRAVHAKVFFGMLARYVEDSRVDAVEVSRLHRLHGLLSRLGWAPGESIADRRQ